MAKLSNELYRYFFEEDRTAKIPLVNLLGIAKERIFGFLFVLFSIPSALPVPAPGYSIPFGIVMFILASQLILGAEKPWLPKKWQRYELDLKRIQTFIKKECLG